LVLGKVTTVVLEKDKQKRLFSLEESSHFYR